MGIAAREWVATEFGGPDVLALRERELPPPAAGEVLIDVRACGVNPVDYKRISGRDQGELPLPSDSRSLA